MDGVGLRVLPKEIKQALERICTGFEKRGDYHERPIQRLPLTIPGIRPALIPVEAVPMVRAIPPGVPRTRFRLRFYP